MNLEAAIGLAQLGQNQTVCVSGFKILIQHPKGSIREIKDEDGKTVYKANMYSHYGEIVGTKGRDGDPVDCFVGQNEKAPDVFIVHMLDKGPDPNAREDEDKVCIGYNSADEAKQAFLLHYPENFYGGMTILPVETFRKQLKTASLPYRRKKITAHAKMARS